MSVKTQHAVGRIKGADILYENKNLKNNLLQAAWNCQLSVISHTYHEFEPQGLSMIILLAESHLTIHTYPELGFCDLDCYTCGEKDPEAVIHEFAKLTKMTIESIKKIDRN